MKFIFSLNRIQLFLFFLQAKSLRKPAQCFQQEIIIPDARKEGTLDQFVWLAAQTECCTERLVSSAQGVENGPEVWREPNVVSFFR